MPAKMDWMRLKNSRPDTRLASRMVWLWMWVRRYMVATTTPTMPICSSQVVSGLSWGGLACVLCNLGWTFKGYLSPLQQRGFWQHRGAQVGSTRLGQAAWQQDVHTGKR